MAGNTTTVTTTSSGMSDADFEAFFESRGYIRLYALAFGCGMALIVFIGSILIIPPPQRRWPKKAPLCGFLPWCLISRLLGYGLVQWETGHMLGYVEYIKETHELLSLYFGDMNLISKYARYSVTCMDFCCNFAMTMALTDATGTIMEGEDVWLDHIWLYVCIFIFQILFGIATRLSAIGSTVHRFIKEYMFFCFGVCVFSLTMSLMYTNVIATRSCNSPCVAYNYVTVFLLSQVMGWLLIQPLVLTIKFFLGCLLWWICKDYLTFTSVAMVPVSVGKFKHNSAKAEAFKENFARSMSLKEFQAREHGQQRANVNDDLVEDGTLSIVPGAGGAGLPLGVLDVVNNVGVVTGKTPMMMEPPTTQKPFRLPPLPSSSPNYSDQLSSPS